MEEGGAALGVHAHVELPGRLDHLLPLVPAGLVVAFDGKGANGLHPAQVRAGVVEAVDHGLEIAVGTVEDGAGGEDPRPYHVPRLHHLRLAKHHLRVGGGVVGGGDAVGQVGVVGPLLLRAHALPEGAQVRVHVHEARHDGLTGGVDGFGAGGDGDLPGRADGQDPVVFHHEGAVFNYLVALHGDDPGVGKGEPAFGHVGVQHEVDFQAHRIKGRDGFGPVLHKGEAVFEVVGKVLFA